MNESTGLIQRIQHLNFARRLLANARKHREAGHHELSRVCLRHAAHHRRIIERIGRA